MTPRGVLLLLGGVGLVLTGWYAGWPELTALGAASLALVVSAVLLVGRTPRVAVSLDHSNLQVVRGQQARVRVSLRTPSRRHSLRLVDGPPKAPARTVAVPGGRSRTPTVLELPVDTSVRGEHQLGPFSVLRGDPWSIVRRVAGRSEGGTVLVRPRTHPVRRGLERQHHLGDAEAMSRRRGDDHFHALRDYVLGDEPRTVHWRSSARAGRLVVKQQVSAASDGTTIVLDIDSTAYGSDEAFGEGFVAARFEAAVEVAASLSAARATGAERVHLVTTARTSSVVSAASGSAQALVDALAVVQALPPVDAAPDELPGIIRRTRCSRLVVVTGTPSPLLLAAVRVAARGTASTLVVRTAGPVLPPPPGLRVLDVESAEDLA